MYKINKLDLKIFAIFAFTAFIIMFLLTLNGSMIGAKVDYISQHMAFPNFLRELFYENKDLLPDFMLNLGGGQNIYNISYYGLYNPLIMISYLFPFIPMYNYIVILMYLVAVGSSILFYIYLKNNNMSTLCAFLISFCFLTSAPLIYHSHKHIMYIAYMPFMVLGLFGVDKYIKDKKSYLLIISLTFIIFISFYFALPCFLVLFCYGIYRYIETKEEVNIKELVKWSFKYIIPFALSGFMSAILLFPTLYSLTGGRLSIVSNTNILLLLAPIPSFIYNPFGAGMTLVPILCLILMLKKGSKLDKLVIITLVVVATFGIFNFILNGFMYVNTKSVIPLLPVFLYFAAKGMEIFLNNTSFKKQYIIAYTLTSCTIICIIINFTDPLMNNNDYFDKSTTYKELYNKLEFDDSFYRTNDQTDIYTFTNTLSNINEYKSSIYSSSVNPNYYYFVNDVMSSDIPSTYRFMVNGSSNIFTQSYLSEKYIYTKHELGLGYKYIDKVDDIFIYENENVLSLGYASSNYISTSDFSKMNYAQRSSNMLGSIVKDDLITTNSLINPTKIDVNDILDFSNLDYEVNDKIKINENKFTLNLKQDMSNKILFLKFDVETEGYKKNVFINNQHNSLSRTVSKYQNQNNTFEYCFVDPTNLEVEFDVDFLEIENIEMYYMDYSDYLNSTSMVDNFNINTKLTKGDKIIGDINVSKDSYFTLSIPYDKGFTILVDGKKQNYEMVNTAFIGFEIEEGYHTIEIEYSAPLKNESLVVSIISLVIAISYCIYEFKKTDKSIL